MPSDCTHPHSRYSTQCRPCAKREHWEKRKLDATVRFWSKVEKTDGCWLWTGSRKGPGYGTFWLDGRTVGAHRFAYLSTGATIPPGMEIDHVCDNPPCVRPDHLRVVTPRANTLRSNNRAAKFAVADRCVNGHPFDAANTYMRPSGGRACRTCRAAHSKRRYAESR